MKAVCWYGVHDVRVVEVPDPVLLNPHDAIIKVSSTAICGSDLHLYNGFIPSMQPGDILGHEFMGEVVEVGEDVRKLAIGDRVVVPFPIACGACYFCKHEMWSLCDNSNPKAELAETLYGQSPSGIFGYSHLMGGYAGGQAEYVRVPFADVGPFKVPEDLEDEQALFLTDILPTGYQAAENGDIEPGDVVAVWGCGPVGQFAIQSARLLGAERVIAIDKIPERLRLAREFGGAETIQANGDTHGATETIERLKSMTAGRGPDVCIDAVGMEASGHGILGVYDRVMQSIGLETDRPHALRQAIQACRKGGRVSIPGVYGGFIDKVSMGAAFNKSLTFKMGQTHVHKYLQPLMKRIQAGDIDPACIITHTLSLDQAPYGYQMFRDKSDECVKIVLKPGMQGEAAA